MQSKPKSNSIITSVFDAERNVITYTVLGEGDIEFDLNKVHAANMAHAAVHGFIQRIPDAAAIGLTDDDGNVIPKADRTAAKFARMKALVEFYEAGGSEWSRVGTGGGGKSLTIEGIARVKGWTYERAEESVDRHAATMFEGDRRKALDNLRKTSAALRDAMSAIRTERDAAKATVDSDDALEAMD